MLTYYSRQFPFLLLFQSLQAHKCTKEAMIPFTLMISFSGYVLPTQAAFDGTSPELLCQRKNTVKQTCKREKQELFFFKLKS